MKKDKILEEEIIEKVLKEILNDKNAVYLGIGVIFDKYLAPTPREQLARHIQHLIEIAIQKAKKFCSEKVQEIIDEWSSKEDFPNIPELQQKIKEDLK